MSQQESSPAPHQTALAGELAAAFREGVEKYGLRGLEQEIFEKAAIEALEERLAAAGAEPTAQRMKELLAKAPRADFVLLIAARHGDQEEAMESFRRLHAGLLPRLYQHFGARRAEAEELADETMEALVFGAFRRDRSPAFLGYEAKAPVEKWLAGFVWNDWASRSRARGRAREAAATELRLTEAWPLVVPAAGSAEDAPDAKEVGGLVYAGMAAAVLSKAVAPEELQSYCYWVLSRRAQQSLAAKLGVDPATFSRRRDRCQAALSLAVKSHLLSELRPGEYFTVCKEIDLGLSQDSLGLYQPIRRFCRRALRYLRFEKEEVFRRDSAARDR